MASDEWKEEIELMETIYPDNLSVKSDFTLHINTILESDLKGKVEIELQIMSLPGYPHTLPTIALEIIQDEKNQEQLLDEDKAFLLAKVHEEAEMLLGTAMIFALVSLLKEEAEKLIELKLLHAIELEKEAERAALKQRNEGTPVNEKTFKEWWTEKGRRRFEEINNLLHEKEVDDGKISGKNLFLLKKGLLDEGDVEDEVS